jgi:hypothetical protein
MFCVKKTIFLTTVFKSVAPKLLHYEEFLQAIKCSSKPAQHLYILWNPFKHNPLKNIIEYQELQLI